MNLRAVPVSCLSLVFLTSPCTAGTVLFGPEQFTRSTGTPSTEQRQFETYGYEDPFVLHLRNGTPDGKNRCSSATVSLDGRTVLGPFDISQKVAEKEVFVSAAEVALLEVRLASAPGCGVSISITGTPRLIGTEGGIFTYRHGVTLSLPAGALAEPTRIEVLELPLAAAQAIVNERDQAYRSHTKRVIGGFIGKPDGLVFGAPIRARLPALPLEPRERAFPLQVDLDRGTYRLIDGEVAVLGEQGGAELEVRHFSGIGVGAGQDVCPADDPCCSIEQACRTCGSWSEACGCLDAIQPACCTIPYQARHACPKTAACVCCEELSAVSVSSEVDRGGTVPGSGSACELVFTEVNTTFPFCNNPDGTPGPVTGHDVQATTSEDCDKDLTMEVVLQETQPMLVCEERQIQATLQGTNREGRLVVSWSDPRLFTWDTSMPEVAVLTDALGSVRALAEGVSQLQATATDKRYTSAAVPLEVVAREAHIRGPAGEGPMSLDQGDTQALELVVEGIGAPVAVSWSSDDPATATVDPATGVVTGLAIGTTQIRARLDTARQFGEWCEARVEAMITVEVRPRRIHISLPDDLWEFWIRLGERRVVPIVLTDDEGNELPASAVALSFNVVAPLDCPLCTPDEIGAVHLAASIVSERWALEVCGRKAGLVSIEITANELSRVYSHVNIVGPRAVTVDLSSSTIAIGNQIFLGAVVELGNGRSDGNEPVSWEILYDTSRPAPISFEVQWQHLAVRGVSSGDVEVVASVRPGDCLEQPLESDRAKVHVIELTIRPFSESFMSWVGQDLQLSAEVVDPSGQVGPNQAIDWSTSDPLVAEHRGGGLFAFVGPGMASVTARLAAHPMASASVVVVVVDQLKGHMDAHGWLQFVGLTDTDGNTCDFYTTVEIDYIARIRERRPDGTVRGEIYGEQGRILTVSPTCGAPIPSGELRVSNISLSGPPGQLSGEGWYGWDSWNPTVVSLALTYDDGTAGGMGISSLSGTFTAHPMSPQGTGTITGDIMLQRDPNPGVE
jgi:hypothetical protein